MRRGAWTGRVRRLKSHGCVLSDFGGTDWDLALEEKEVFEWRDSFNTRLGLCS